MADQLQNHQQEDKFQEQKERSEREDAQAEELWIDLPEFKSPRFDLREPRLLEDDDMNSQEDPDIQGDPDMTYSSQMENLSSFSEPSLVMNRQSHQKKAMYPFTVHAYDFKLGDWVKAILSEVTLSSYPGKVIGILPKANKVIVKWPHLSRQEDPEWLVKLNQEESGVAVTSSHTILRESCRPAQNLVKVALGLRKAGFSDVAAFLKMKQAFGQRLPMSWIKGAVEVSWPKRTASYSSEAETVKSLYRYAEDIDSIGEDVPLSKEASVDGWIDEVVKDL